MTRRFFIGGAAAFGVCGAFGGNRFVPKVGIRESGKLNLRFGVISDIHVGTDVTQKNHASHCQVLRKALKWFDAQGVDAVVIAGDLADNGIISQLEGVYSVWNEIFPNDKGFDGRPVERLFIYGNHDMGGIAYTKWLPWWKDQPEDVVRPKLIYTDPKAAWERVFKEPYAPIWRKNVKGYDFVGAHWLSCGCRDFGDAFNPTLADFYEKQGKSFGSERPFFHIQHPHPKDTCYGPWAWGHDDGLSTRLLSRHSNVIAFSGHSHYSLTDERAIWQGAFTSIGASSLRYGAQTYNARAPFGYENTGAVGEEAARLDAMKTMERYGGIWECTQGMLVSVYDDCITIRRREFQGDLDLGADWVMPLPSAEPRPFAFASRARRARPPQFPEGATLTIVRTKGKTRKTNGHEPVEKDVVRLTFPAALAEVGARPMEYEVAASSSAGERAVFHVIAEGYNQAVSHKRAKSEMCCTIPVDRLPEGASQFEVIPLDCWWNRGRPIVSS